MGAILRARPAYTTTLLPRLTQQSGAQVLLCWGERVRVRVRVSKGYMMHFEPLDGTDLQNASKDA